MGRWRTAAVTGDSGGAYEKLWSWDGLVELFWIVAGRQTPKYPHWPAIWCGLPVLSGHSFGQDNILKRWAEPRDDVCFALSGATTDTEKSHGAPFRGSWKGMLAVLHEEGEGGGGEERRGNGKGRRVEGSCSFSLCFGCAGCSLRCTGFSCWSTRTQQFQQVGLVIPWHVGS